MQKKTMAEIRRCFINYFANHPKYPHTPVPSSPLVLKDDPSLLFANAGMNQFKSLFIGEEKCSYPNPRAVSSQLCMRVSGKHNDIDEVGDATHHTLFEMLGNFSFGDYGAEGAIELGWGFLTKVLGIPADRLWVTVFHEDDETHELWRKITGIPAERITRLGEKDNFWSMGDTGPCGPCTEVFYDHGEHVPGGPPGTPDEDLGRFVEIWNFVLMRYDRQADGTLVPLPKPCIDTGMGLERISAVMQGVANNYEVDALARMCAPVANVLGDAPNAERVARVIVDHMRAATFLLAEDVLPGNEGRNYVCRRMIRRAAQFAHQCGVELPVLHRFVSDVVREMGDAYPHIAEREAFITEQLREEETRFAAVIDQGSQRLQQALTDCDENKMLPGSVAFQLYDTYGFPYDLTVELSREQGIEVDRAGYDEAMSKQRENSQAGQMFKAMAKSGIDTQQTSHFAGYDSLQAAGKVLELWRDEAEVTSLSEGQRGVVILDQTAFYPEGGGQVGDTGILRTNSGVFRVEDTQKVRDAIIHVGEVESGEISQGTMLEAVVDEARADIMRNHSATHLMHEALRNVLGDHVQQKGSLVQAKRLRFDFSHSSAMTAEQVRAVEDQVNHMVWRNLSCQCEMMSKAEAEAKGAMALFGEKYGDEVRVVTMGEYSVELCGGTHVSATGEIGLFKITAESGVARGIRRIEAVTGSYAWQWFEARSQQLDGLANTLKVPADQLEARLGQLLDEEKQLRQSLGQLKQKQRQGAVGDLHQQAETIAGTSVLMVRVAVDNMGELRRAYDQIRQAKPYDVMVMVGSAADGGSAPLLVAVNAAAGLSFDARELFAVGREGLQAKGGGKPDMVQGACQASAEAVDKAMAAMRDWLRTRLEG